MRWALWIAGMVTVLGCGSEGAPPRTDTSTAPPEVATSAPTAVASPPRPTVVLPPEPPPAEPALAHEVPEWEAKLAANKAYQAALAPGAEADFLLLATGVSQMIADGGLVGETIAAMQAKKLIKDGAIAVYMVFVRLGRLPTDFEARLRAVIAAGATAPHLGVWAPFEKGKPPHDFTALALWANRDKPAYVRELLAARTDPHPVSVWVAHDTAPPRPYLATELGALEWLARLDRLTDQEQRRLADAKIDAAALLVPIETLLLEYKANEIRADGTYKDKWIRTTGIVRDVKRDVTGTVYVTLGTGAMFEIPVAQCFFDDKDVAAVTALSKGDKATIRGHVDGLTMNVLLRQCRLE